MALPEAVRRQAARAEEIVTATQQANVHNPGNVIQNPDLQLPQAAEPAVKPPPEPAIQPSPQQSQDHELDNLNPDQLRQRLRSIQGLLRSEAEKAKRLQVERDRLSGTVESLSSLVTGLQGQVQGMTNRLTAMEQAGQAPDGGATGSPPEADAAKRNASKIDPDNFDGYGDEMRDLVQLVNDQQAVIDQLRSQYGEQATTVDARINEVTQSFSQQSFYRDLSAAAPDWQDINQRDDWLSWLTQPATIMEPGEVYGSTRDDLLKQAHQRGDGLRVAKLIRDFKADMGIAGHVAPPQGGNGNREGLEGQVMPGQGAASAPNPAGFNQGGPSYTAADVNKASLDFSKGKITEKEYEKILGSFTQSMGGVA